MRVYEALQNARLQHLERCAPVLSTVNVRPHCVDGMHIVCGHLWLRLHFGIACHTYCLTSDGGSCNSRPQVRDSLSATLGYLLQAAVSS